MSNELPKSYLSRTNEAKPIEPVKKQKPIGKILNAAQLDPKIAEEIVFDFVRAAVTKVKAKYIGYNDQMFVGVNTKEYAGIISKYIRLSKDIEADDLKHIIFTLISTTMFPNSNDEIVVNFINDVISECINILK